MSKIDTAFLLTAGLGTRLYPITKNIPKALVPIHGKTLLERNIKYLAGFGIKKIVINVHYMADKIICYLKENKNFGLEIIISDETQKILETGGGLKFAEKYLNKSSFVMMNVDILTDLALDEMISYHFDKDCISTLAVTKRESTRKLIFEKESKKLSGWLNKETGEKFGDFSFENSIERAFSGLHILSPTIFDFLPEPTEAYSIVKPYIQMAMQGKKILAFDHSGRRIVDVGKAESIKIAENLFQD